MPLPPERVTAPAPAEACPPAPDWYGTHFEVMPDEIPPDRLEVNRAERRELSRPSFLRRHDIPWHTRSCSINRWPRCDPVPVIRMRAARARWAARWSAGARLWATCAPGSPGSPDQPVTSVAPAAEVWAVRPLDRARAATTAAQLALSRRTVVAHLLRSTVNPTRGPDPVLSHRPARREREVAHVT